MLSQRVPKMRSETVAPVMPRAGYRIVRNNFVSRQSTVDSPQARRSRRRRHISRPTIGQVATRMPASHGSPPWCSLGLRALRARVRAVAGGAGFGAGAAGLALALAFAAAFARL